jgi:hypothetical protein
VSEDKWQRAAKHAETVFGQYVAVAVGHALMDCEKAHPGYRDWLAAEVLGTQASVVLPVDDTGARRLAEAVLAVSVESEGEADASLDMEAARAVLRQLVRDGA